MKKHKRKFIHSNCARKLLLAAICAIIVCMLSCTLFACSKKIVLPENADKTQEDTPSETQPQSDVNTEPTEEERKQLTIEAILSSLANVGDLNAETVINVSFGGKTLSEKTTVFERTTTGGTIHTKTTTLDAANAKNPYKTEEGEQALSAEDFERLFPIFDLSFASNIAGIQLAEKDGVSAISFSLEKSDVVGILKLSVTEANNITSNIEIVVTAFDDLPKAVGFAYTSTNGNTVQIVTTYTNQE